MIFRLKNAFTAIKTKYCNANIYFRKVHVSISSNAEVKNCSRFVSFEDTRVQKHLKYIQAQCFTFSHDKKSLYSYDTLRTINTLIKEIEDLKSESSELDIFITELKEKDNELLSVAEVEKNNLQDQLNTLESNVINYLIPNEIIDDKDIIMELTAGVGGQEAMLFTKNMFDMYYNFAQWKGWACEILKYDETGLGGLRSSHISISGKNAYKILKYESGVHRVQRVPKTEKSGRIHTSTMTVAVLPQPSEIDIIIQPKDIELEFKRSGGAGGQHVNTTDSCVRLYHKATGIVVECQMERDQHANRKMALKSLRAKLYERELESYLKETNSNRKLQIGSAARSEKVRTYNFVQDRITDHRAHINIFNIDNFFKGEQLLDNLIAQLEEWHSSETLMEILRKYDTET